MTYPVKHISLTINCPAQKVYEFASDPTHLPQWAAGLAHSNLRPEGEFWITESPMGIVKIKFSTQNSFGVMDNDVVLPSGEINHNPFRVISNKEGCEVIFSLFHLPQISRNEFERDMKMVMKDLEKLKEILEDKSKKVRTI